MARNESTNEPLFIRASEIVPKEIRWLWYPFFPLGKVSIVQGNPGDGKSYFLLTVAALLTTGRPLPFSEREPEEPMTVIYQTTEDDAEDTVVPRFLDAGGDGNRLIFIKEEANKLTFADERIGEVIRQTGAKLLILDPLSSYIGMCSINSANEVRPQFNHLIRAAKENDCAIIVVDHMNKMTGQSIIFRTVGSIDIVGAVRSVVTVVMNSGRDKRYFVLSKSNLAPLGSCIVFTLDNNGITFLEEMDARAEELIENGTSVIGRPDERLQEAVQFIRTMLDEGAVPSSECEKRLDEAGIKTSTAKTAKKLLGVVSTKTGHSWSWSLPQ